MTVSDYRRKAGVRSPYTSKVATKLPPDAPVATIAAGECVVIAEQRSVEPSKPRRNPLSDQFRNAALALTSKVGTLERLSEDDRFTRHAKSIATIYRSDLIRAIDTLQYILDKLPKGGEPR